MLGILKGREANQDNAIFTAWSTIEYMLEKPYKGGYREV